MLKSAFIPQFIDPTGDYVWQVILLGVTFMVEAAVSDSIYALLTGRARAMLIATQPLPVPRSSTRTLAPGAMRSSAHSTSNSVSGRGINTAGETLNSRPKNSRVPVM